MNNFGSLDINISIATEKVFSVGGIGITNATITGAFGLVIVLAILFYVSGKVKKKKYNRFVGLIQWVFEGLLGSINDIIPDKKLARKIMPLSVTIFFLVLISYWLSVIPGLETIMVHGVPLIRSMTADLNFTLAIAIITIVATRHDISVVLSRIQ